VTRRLPLQECFERLLPYYDAPDAVGEEIEAAWHERRLRLYCNGKLLSPGYIKSELRLLVEYEADGRPRCRIEPVGPLGWASVQGPARPGEKPDYSWEVDVEGFKALVLAAPIKPRQPALAGLVAAVKQLPAELAAALKPPAKDDDAPDKGKGEASGKSSKRKKREPTPQWQITEALLRADHPQGVPDTARTANLRRKIVGVDNKRWKAECERRGISVPAPSSSSVDRVRKSLTP
jgi:hypothetical protein